MEEAPIKFDWKKVLTLGRNETPGMHYAEHKRSDGVVTEIYEVDTNGVYSETTQLWFTDKKGNKYNLRTGLPEGTKLQNFSRDYPHASKDEKQRHFGGARGLVTFGDLKQEGALLALLHEKGHVNAIDQGLHPENNAEGNPIEGYKKKFPHRTIEDIKAEGGNLNDFYKFEYSDIGGKPMVTYVPHDIVIETAKYLAHREKIADEFMEKEYKAIRADGIDMEIQSAPNPEDISNIVLIQLSSYGFKTPAAFEPINPELHNATEITNIFTDGKGFTPLNVGVFKRFIDEINEVTQIVVARKQQPS